MLLIKNAQLQSMGSVGDGLFDILIEDGKIAKVAENIEAAEGCTVIDAENKIVTPGLVEPHCHLGGASPSGQNINEITGPAQEGLRVCDGIDLSSEDFNRALKCGVTTLAVCPGSSNIIGGTFMTVKTYGKGKMKATVINEEHGYKMALGENPKMNYSKRSMSPATRMGNAAVMREHMFKAKKYYEQYKAFEKGEGQAPKYDFGLHSLMMIFDGCPVKIHAHQSDDILTAIRIGKEFGLNITIDHCTEGYMITEDLKAAGFPCIVGPTIGGKSKFELAGKTLMNPVLLEAAGVRFALTTDSGVIPMEGLAMQASYHVKKGLSRKTAMEALTINGAWAIQLDNRVGSIEVGKDADLVIWSEHPLETMSRAETVIIDGEVRLQNREVVSC